MLRANIVIYSQSMPAQGPKYEAEIVWDYAYFKQSHSKIR